MLEAQRVGGADVGGGCWRDNEWEERMLEAQRVGGADVGFRV
jgi:hypothetical protein